MNLPLSLIHLMLVFAVGGIQQVPICKEGQIVPGNVMKLTLSCDHRVVMVLQELLSYKV